MGGRWKHHARPEQRQECKAAAVAGKTERGHDYPLRVAFPISRGLFGRMIIPGNPQLSRKLLEWQKYISTPAGCRQKRAEFAQKSKKCEIRLLSLYLLASVLDI